MSTTRRLAACAPPMWRVSWVVRGQVRDSLDLVFKVGGQRVKKIVRPVHVYYP
jgi:hypothetical protein